MGRKIPEVQASSMADIAFLLLIFFLVTTTIAADKGITVKLPPIPEDPDDIEDVNLNDRNLLKILVNFNDELLVEDEAMDLEDLKEFTKRFVANNGADKTMSDSPDKAVVSLKNDRATTYETYIAVQNELKSAYSELRDETSDQKFGVTFKYLTQCCENDGKESICCQRRKDIRDIYPIKISEAEPEKNK